jgi:hypothetical protein
MNKIKLGFFSLSHHSPGGDDRAYLEWHQLDHMPEQYQLPGLLFAQRWASTAAYESVRAAAVDDWAKTAHVVCYLMGSIYLIVEEPTDAGQQDRYIQRMHTDVLPALNAVPGVAGVLAFGTSSAIRRDTFSPGSYRITTCCLDGDPATVGERLAPVLKSIWSDAPVRPVLAAPFESMMIWDWKRFAPA